MSLPRALNALARGEIERPIDAGSVGALLPATPIVPKTPRPPPRRYPEELEQEAQNAADRDAMRFRLEAKRMAVAASAVDAERRHQINRRLDEAEQYLREEMRHAR